MPEDCILDAVRLGYLAAVAANRRDFASEWCIRCNLDSYSGAALHTHKRKSNRHNIYSSCRLDFPTTFGLKDHYDQSPRHAYCPFCDLHEFRTAQGLKRHYADNWQHRYCEYCDELFFSHCLLKEDHVQNLRHQYCQYCDTHYDSYKELYKYYVAYHDWCVECEEVCTPLEDYGFATAYTHDR
ncbi:hypothetical protein C8Q74DRAFT_1388368 [Fomes fomentarius]|nr:hypothetical protein C8Q74DRAFT_1388368 [Fomes fomentarius]